MRVISQDGTIDVPYDYFSLSVASGKYKDVEVAYIYCHNLSSPKGTKLAEYSSKEKAQKAMEMLREQYMRNNALYIDRENNARVIPQNSLFQFPKDEDVEV